LTGFQQRLTLRTKRKTQAVRQQQALNEEKLRLEQENDTLKSQLEELRQSRERSLEVEDLRLRYAEEMNKSQRRRQPLIIWGLIIALGLLGGYVGWQTHQQQQRQSLDTLNYQQQQRQSLDALTNQQQRAFAAVQKQLDDVQTLRMQLEEELKRLQSKTQSGYPPPASGTNQQAPNRPQK